MCDIVIVIKCCVTFRGKDHQNADVNVINII